MTDKGLYVPGADGQFRFKGVKEEEDRPILTYEEGTGVLLLNFHLVFRPRNRKLRDIIVQARPDGLIGGIVITSAVMGPEELRKLELMETGGGF